MRAHFRTLTPFAMIRPLLALSLALAALALPASAQEASRAPRSGSEAVERPSEDPRARDRQGRAPRAEARPGPDARRSEPAPGRDIEALRRRFQQLDPQAQRAVLERLRAARSQDGQRMDRASGRGDSPRSRAGADRSELRQRFQRLDPDAQRAMLERLRAARSQDAQRMDRARGRGDSRRAAPGRGDSPRSRAGADRSELRQRLQQLDPEQRRQALRRLKGARGGGAAPSRSRAEARGRQGQRGARGASPRARAGRSEGRGARPVDGRRRSGGR